MAKIDYERTPDGYQRLLDGNIKVTKSLYIPVFEGNPTLNDNPNEPGAIGISSDLELIFYNGTIWQPVAASFAAPVKITIAKGQPVNTFIDITAYPQFNEYASIFTFCPEFGNGTITTVASSTAIVGVGTSFTTQFQVGDNILANGEIHTITAIADDTHMTTSAWTNSISNILYNTNNEVQYNDISITKEKKGNLLLGWNIYGHSLDSSTLSEILIIIIKP